MKKIITVFVALMLIALIHSCKNNTGSTPGEYQVPEEIAALPVGTTLGLRAPEIELPGLDGEKVKLSSLHGKLVLVDFWASWCNPCRKENPILVEVYKKYAGSSFIKGEGFEIFSVSLDRKEEDWKDAIVTDKINWTYQLGDMLGARTQPAQDYGVQMIPANFLLDQNGVIIAINLRGEALEEKLESLIKQK